MSIIFHEKEDVNREEDNIAIYGGYTMKIFELPIMNDSRNHFMEKHTL